MFLRSHRLTERLAHCKQCNLRNASPTIVAYHTHLSRPDPTAPTSTASTMPTTTATTATSTVAPLPAPQPTAIVRAPGRLISTGAAAAQPEAAARDEPAAEPEPQYYHDLHVSKNCLNTYKYIHYVNELNTLT